MAPEAKRSAEIGVDHTGEIFRRHVAHQIATLPDRQSDRMPVPHAFIHESRAQFGVGNTEQEPYQRPEKIRVRYVELDCQVAHFESIAERIEIGVGLAGHIGYAIRSEENTSEL